MNIGFLTPEYVGPERFDGGLANYLHKVAHALEERGHHSVIFVQSHRDHQWKDERVDVIEVKRVVSGKSRALLPYRLREFVPAMDRIRSSKRMAKAVWNYHHKNKLDLLQTSSYASPGFALRKNGKIPMVCRVSSYTPLVRSAFGRQRSFQEYLYDWLEIRTVLDSDAAFSPSQFIADQFDRIESFRPIVLRSPLDSTNVEPDQSLYEKKFSSFPYFLIFGTLSRIKGSDVIGDAIAELANRNVTPHFVFIGRDDGLPDGKKMMDYIRQKNSGAAERIHYTEAIPKSQLYPVIAHALAVLMPSRVDNCPNSCLEAHSMGVPVIGTYQSSLDEMIEQNKTGWLIENGNAKDLAAAIERCIELTETERSEMRNDIRRYVECIRNEDRIGQLVSFYERLL